jgi:hypothetical protein
MARLTKQQQTAIAKSNSLDELDGHTLFEHFWMLYGRRGSKHEAELAWKKLTREEMIDATTYAPAYVQETPDFKYRLHACRYLRRRIWKDMEERLQAVGTSLRDDWTPPFTREHLRKAAKLPEDVVNNAMPVIKRLALLARRLVTTTSYSDRAMDALYEEMVMLGVDPDEAAYITTTIGKRNRAKAEENA